MIRSGPDSGKGNSGGSIDYNLSGPLLIDRFMKNPRIGTKVALGSMMEPGSLSLVSGVESYALFQIPCTRE